MAEEKRFEQRVRLWMKENLSRQWHFKVFGNAFQESGIPDLVGVINGRMIALEMKSSKGKASKIQEYKIKLIREAGGYAAIVSPKNWDQIKEDLKKIDEGGWKNE